MYQGLPALQRQAIRPCRLNSYSKIVKFVAKLPTYNKYLI